MPATSYMATFDEEFLMIESSSFVTTNGLTVIIDKCDEDVSCQQSWFAIKKDHMFYVVTNIYDKNLTNKSKLKRVYFHRYILGEIPKGMVVDHINGNSLDNRRSNLRVVRQQQNKRNLGGALTNSKSGVRGVYWHKQRNKWAASIRHDGKNISLGLHDDIEEARKARLEKEFELWDHNDTYRTKAMIGACGDH